MGPDRSGIESVSREGPVKVPSGSREGLVRFLEEIQVAAPKRGFSFLYSGDRHSPINLIKRDENGKSKTWNYSRICLVVCEISDPINKSNQLEFLLIYCKIRK